MDQIKPNPTVPRNSSLRNDESFFSDVLDSMDTKTVETQKSRNTSDTSSLVKVTKEDFEDSKQDEVSTEYVMNEESLGMKKATYARMQSEEKKQYNQPQKLEECSLGSSVKCTKNGKVFTGEVVREEPLTIQVEHESFARYSWYYDSIEQVKDVYTEVDIVLEAHASFPWGVAANLSDPVDEWTVTQVTKGQQMSKKGVRVGWQYIKYNGQFITPANAEEVRYELMQGNPGVVTFRKSNVYSLIDIHLDHHQEYEWGISANLSDDYTEWVVTSVKSGKQADLKGVAVGWKYLKWNHETIDEHNANTIRQKLLHGEKGIVTFGRELSYQTPSKITREVKKDVFQAAPSAVYVCGSSVEELNGQYQRGANYHNDKVYYHSSDKQYFIRWSKQNKQWEFCNKLDSKLSAKDSLEYTAVKSQSTKVYGFVKNKAPMPNIITNTWIINDRPCHRLRIRPVDDNLYVTVHFESETICDWGMDINFDQPCSEWQVTHLTDHLWADEEGIQTGWILRKHNFMDIHESNRAEIQQLIQNGEECQITFEIPGVFDTEGTCSKPVSHFDANAECPEFQNAEMNITVEGLKFHKDANGMYTKSNRCYFGRLVYIRMSHSHMYYLRYHPSGAWVIDDVAFHQFHSNDEKHGEMPPGLAVVCDNVRMPWLVREQWVEFESVYGGYVCNRDISINGSNKSSETAETSFDSRLPEEVFEEAEDSLHIQGFRGCDAYNGWYYKGDECVNGHVYYENNDEDHHSYIYYDLPTECWVFGSTLDDSHTHFAYVHSTARSVTEIQSTGWYYRHDHFGTYVPFPTLSIVGGDQYHQERLSERRNSKAKAMAHKKSQSEKHYAMHTADLRKNACTGTIVSSEGDCKESIAIHNVPGVRFSGSSVKEFAALEGLYLPCGKYNAHYYYQLEKKIGVEQEETYVILFYDGTDTWFLANRLGKESIVFAACHDHVSEDHCRFECDNPVTWNVIPTVNLQDKNSAATNKDLTTDDLIQINDVTLSEVNLPSIKKAVYVHEEMDEAEEQITHQNASPRIIITGRRGRNEIINGSYVKLDQFHEGRVCYQKVDQTCVLRWHPSGVWMISVHLREGLRCFAYCCDVADYPADIQQPWQVRLNYLFQEDINIRVKCQKTLENIVHKNKRKNVAKLAKDFPEFPASANIALPLVLSRKMYSELCTEKSDTGYTLDQVIRPGIDFPSKVNTGVQAGDRDCYHTFAPLFNGLISAVHEGFQTDHHCHFSNFDISEVFDSGIDDDYITGCSIEISRNIEGRKFPCWSQNYEKRDLENILTTCLVFEDPSLQGTYVPCTEPESQGCGVYTNSLDDCRILINQKEHVTVNISSPSSNLKDIFDRGVHAIDNMELILRSLGYHYMHDMHLGYLMSDPMNTGTGLKISVTCELPLVTSHPQYAEILSNLRLCGIKESKTSPEGVIISNVDRIGFTEVQCLQLVLDGIENLIHLEHLLYSGQDIEEHLPERKEAAWTKEAMVKNLRSRVRRVSRTHAVKQHVGPAPESIVVTGRRGENNVINGMYFKDQYTHNSRPSYSKTNFVTEVHLSWHSSGYWVFDDEISSELKGFAMAKSDAIYPTLIRHQWKVLSQEMFVLDDQIRIRDFDKVHSIKFDDSETLHFKSSKIFGVKHEDAPEDKMSCPLYRVSSRLENLEAVMDDEYEQYDDKYPENLFVSGDHGVYELINGSYMMMAEPHAGRPCWVHCDQKCYLRYHPQGCWLFSEDLGSRLKGYAVCQTSVDCPSRIERTWRVCVNGNYVKDANLKVTDLSVVHAELHE